MKRLILFVLVCLLLAIPALAIDDEALSPVETTEQWLAALFSQDTDVIDYYTCDADRVDLKTSFTQAMLPPTVVTFLMSDLFVSDGIFANLDDVVIEAVGELDTQAVTTISGIATLDDAVGEVDFETSIIGLTLEDERWKVCLTTEISRDDFPDLPEMASVIPWWRTEDGTFVLGAEDAPVTIVIFEDYLCPHCQSYHPVLTEFIETEVAAGNANIEFRNLIAIDLEVSPLVFELVECAAITSEAPDAFQKARDTMFGITSTSRFTEASIRQFADAMDLTVNGLAECVETTEGQWQVDAQLAQELGWVRGTPAIGWKTDNMPLEQTNPTRPSVDDLTTFVQDNQ